MQEAKWERQQLIWIVFNGTCINVEGQAVSYTDAAKTRRTFTCKTIDPQLELNSINRDIHGSMPAATSR